MEQQKSSNPMLDSMRMKRQRLEDEIAEIEDELSNGNPQGRRKTKLQKKMRKKLDDLKFVNKLLGRHVKKFGV